MIFGTIFLGKVKAVSGQWIETKFLVLGVPVFPLHSMLVTSSKRTARQGFELPFNYISIIAGYARISTFLAALILFIIGCTKSSYSFLSNDGGERTTFMTWAFVFFALWIYFYFGFGNANHNEIKERSKLGKTIGIYALPDWFDYDTAMQNLKNLEFEYKARYSSTNWKTDLLSSGTESEKVNFFYPLALFNSLIDSSPPSEALLEKSRKTIGVTPVGLPASSPDEAAFDFRNKFLIDTSA